jgi:hypothetical protein
MRLIARERKM